MLPLPVVGDGNDVRPPALPGGAVGETCKPNPGKNPDWYGGGRRCGGGGGCTREGCDGAGSGSDRGVNVPKTGDVVVSGCSSTLERFRGFGDCVMYGDDELVARLPNEWGLVCLSADMGIVDDEDSGRWR